MSGSRKLVFGVGVNDSDYVCQKKVYLGRDGGKIKQKAVWTCPFYKKWHGMLKRCYHLQSMKDVTTYKDCSVCDEWLTFSNFKAWMEKQDWEGKELDKDLIIEGNRVYSPDRCVFISRAINIFVAELVASVGDYPIGVSFNKQFGRFSARCCNPFTGIREFLGYFHCPKEAHLAWLMRKLELAKLLAATQNDLRIAEALISRYERRLQEA